MIVLYRTPDCPRCASIQDALEELAIAHEVVVGTRAELAEVLPSGAKLPTLIDGDEVFSGAEAVIEHLEELERFTELWYKYQSDACYCGEEE